MKKTDKVKCIGCGCLFFESLSRCVRCNEKNPLFVPKWKQLLMMHVDCKWCGQKIPWHIEKCVKCDGYNIYREFKNLWRKHRVAFSFNFISYVFVGSLFLILISPSDQTNSFALAQDGEYWVISQGGVDLLITPEWPSNDADWNRKSLGLIPAGSIVEIIKTKGFGGAWKQVYVLNQNRKPIATGWIYFELVKKSKNLGKGTPK